MKSMLKKISIWLFRKAYNLNSLDKERKKIKHGNFKSIKSIKS